MANDFICDLCDLSCSQPTILAHNDYYFDSLCSQCLEDFSFIPCCCCNSMVHYKYDDINNTDFFKFITDFDILHEFVCPICADKFDINVYSLSYKELEVYFGFFNPIDEWATWGK